jgi:hypothetical protein
MTKLVAAALALAPLALLAGCGGDSTSAPAANQARSGPSNAAAADASADASTAAANAQAGVRIRNRPNEDLLALNDANRRVGLVRAIRQTGNACPLRVEPNPVQQGEYEGMALWTARCDNNRQYAIFIAPNGDVQVRDCADMAELGLPACQPLPEAAPAPPRRRPRPGEVETR